MNSLVLENGGRPVANDDFLVLQERDALLGLPALLAGLGPCVVSGCRLWQTGSQWNVGSGIVWDGTNLLDFSGRSNVTLPARFAPSAATVVDERAYQTGGTKTTIKSQTMDLVAIGATAAGSLVMNTWGCKRWNDVLRGAVRSLHEVQMLGGRGYVPANYNSTGKGLPGTEAWGWALANGQHDTDDLRARFIVGLDPSKADYDTAGKTGGEERHLLTIPELPAHRHTEERMARYNETKKIPNSGVDNAVRDAGYIEENYVGGNTAHENRPPFYVLVMRQWIGLD